MNKAQAVIKAADLEYPNVYHSPGIELWISQILKDFPASTQLILDVGCGLGFWGYLIRSYINPDSFIIGMDISMSKIKDVKFFGIYDALICADASSLPFKEESFSGIISVEVLHSLLPKFREVLRSIEKVVKNRGLIVLSQPSSKEHIKILQELSYDVLGNFLRGLFLVRISNGEVIPARKSLRFRLIAIALKITYKLLGIKFVKYAIAVKIKEDKNG